MRADGDEGRLAHAQAGSNRSDDGARLDERGQEGSDVGAVVGGELGEDGVGPAAGGRVEQAGGRRVRHLGDGLSGEPVAEQVRHEEQSLGGVELGRAGRGGELEDGVERQHLQPVAGVATRG